MTSQPIIRDPEQAARTEYDLIIVGGGIYGVCLALEAGKRGLKSLLVEKGDFGGATTYNHLRTLHGGFRYLQNMDLPRFFESVGERRWYLQNFPGLTRPLPCLMPLYGNGVYRPPVLRTALVLNDILSCHRNRGVVAGFELPAGTVLDPEGVAALFPAVDREGLRGGAVWHDAAMPSPQLLMTALLQRACALGATALNYMAAEELLVEEGQTRGLRCRDAESGAEYVFQSGRLINAAGPSCRRLAATFSEDDPELFKYSLAWNVLFDRPALSGHSLALRAKRPGCPMYFVHGFNGLIMGGTVHSPWSGDAAPEASEEALAAYLADLNMAVPGLNLRREEVLHVYAGLLPAREQGSARLAVREVIRDHGALGGPKGAYSVSGVKFTTARLVAEKVLKLVFPDRPVVAPDKSAPAPTAAPPWFSPDWRPGADEASRRQFEDFIRDQAVLHLDDLVLRRTAFGDDPRLALRLAPELAALFPWDEARREAEVRRVRACFPRLNLNGA